MTPVVDEPVIAPAGDSSRYMNPAENPYLTDEEIVAGKAKNGRPLSYARLSPKHRARAIDLGVISRSAVDDLQDYAAKLHDKTLSKYNRDARLYGDPDSWLSHGAVAGWFDPKRRTVLGRDFHADSYEGMIAPILKKFGGGDPAKEQELRSHMLNWSPWVVTQLAEDLRPAFSDESYPIYLNMDERKEMVELGKTEEMQKSIAETAEWWRQRGIEMPMSAVGGEWSDQDYSLWANAHVSRRSYKDTLAKFADFNIPSNMFRPDMTMGEFKTIRNSFYDPKYGGTCAPAEPGSGVVNVGGIPLKRDEKISGSIFKHFLDRQYGLALLGDYNNLQTPEGIKALNSELLNRYDVQVPMAAHKWDVSQWDNYFDVVLKGKLLKRTEERSESAWGTNQVEKDRVATDTINHLRRFGINMNKRLKEWNDQNLIRTNQIRAKLKLQPLTREQYEPYAMPENPRDLTRGQYEDFSHYLDNYVLSEGQSIKAISRRTMEDRDEKLNRIRNDTRWKFDKWNRAAINSNLGGLFTGDRMSGDELWKVERLAGKEAYDALQSMAARTEMRGTARKIARAFAAGDEQRALGLLGNVYNQGRGVHLDAGDYGPGKHSGLMPAEKRDSTANLAQTIVTSYMRYSGYPMLNKVGGILAIGTFKVENPKHLEAVKTAIKDPNLRPAVRGILSNIQRKYKRRSPEYKQLERLITGVEAQKPAPSKAKTPQEQAAVAAQAKVEADIEDVLDKEAGGGEAGLEDNAGGIIDQIISGFKKMFSLDGLKEMWNKAKGGDWTAWLPLITGGAGLFFLAKGLFSGSIGSMVGGAALLTGGAWLTGGGLDIIGGWLGSTKPSKPEVLTKERAKEIAGQASKNKARAETSEIKPFDPNDEAQLARLDSGLKLYGLKTDVGGLKGVLGGAVGANTNPLDRLKKDLLRMARGEPTQDLAQIVTAAGKRNKLSKDEARQFLGELVAVVQKNVSRPEYRLLIEKVVELNFTGKDSDEIVAVLIENRV